MAKRLADPKQRARIKQAIKYERGGGGSDQSCDFLLLIRVFQMVFSENLQKKPKLSNSVMDSPDRIPGLYGGLVHAIHSGLSYSFGTRLKKTG